MDSGKLVVLSAPSGSGKTSLVKELLKEKLNLGFSISATSRAPRGKEKNNLDYYFLSNDEFVEWEEVYKGVFYGTLFSELENAKEKNLIFDIDVIGGLNIKRKFKDQSLTIFIKPPSLDELEKRLKNRNSETDSNIKIRVDKAKDEMLLADKFDYIVENDILEKSYKEVFKLVNNFINE